jgi:capsular polysaccharide biosynthesis protein
MKDQFSLFMRARIVIGVHGAGFGNAVVSQPGTLLVEITPPKIATTARFVAYGTFDLLSSALGFSHYIYADPSKSNESSNSSTLLVRNKYINATSLLQEVVDFSKRMNIDLRPAKRLV